MKFSVEVKGITEGERMAGLKWIAGYEMIRWVKMDRWDDKGPWVDLEH